jgi:dTDP-4-dehydrorhamnose 3,5-epimerase-like enzyme
MKIEKVYRHGDVVLFKVQDSESTNEKGTLTKELVLEHGEVTGHAHRLAGEVEIVAENEAKKEITFKVLDKAVLTHEEHDRIVLEKGIYLKTTQVEYNPFDDMIQWIRD